MVSDPLPMLVSVLLAPLIVLLVSVWLPVKVATTVGSMAVVTLVDPLKDVPVKPVPKVSVPVVLAVTVVDPPKLTELPLIVIDELVSAEFGMLVKVFDAPDIVLLVRVCRPVRVATVESIATVTLPDPS